MTLVVQSHTKLFNGKYTRKKYYSAKLLANLLKVYLKLKFFNFSKISRAINHAIFEIIFILCNNWVYSH